LCIRSYLCYFFLFTNTPYIMYNVYAFNFLWILFRCYYRILCQFQIFLQMLIFFGLLGVTRDSCLNCPCIIAVHDFGVRSKPNSLHVSSKVSFNSGIKLWSKAGNKWCNVWSPNVAIVINILLIGSFRSTLVFNWCIPQSIYSSLKKRKKQTILVFKQNKGLFLFLFI